MEAPIEVTQDENLCGGKDEMVETVENQPTEEAKPNEAMAEHALALELWFMTEDDLGNESEGSDQAFMSDNDHESNEKHDGDLMAPSFASQIPASASPKGDCWEFFINDSVSYLFFQNCKDWEDIQC